MHPNLYQSNSSASNSSTSKWACWKRKPQKSYCKAYSIHWSFILPIATQHTIESNQVSYQVLSYLVIWLSFLSRVSTCVNVFFKRKFSLIFTGTEVGHTCLKCTGFCCCLKDVGKTSSICQEHSLPHDRQHIQSKSLVFSTSV